jgi:hypothetical protein
VRAYLRGLFDTVAFAPKIPLETGAPAHAAIFFFGLCSLGMNHLRLGRRAASGAGQLGI